MFVYVCVWGGELPVSSQIPDTQLTVRGESKAVTTTPGFAASGFKTPSFVTEDLCVITNTRVQCMTTTKTLTCLAE